MGTEVDLNFNRKPRPFSLLTSLRPFRHVSSTSSFVSLVHKESVIELVLVAVVDEDLVGHGCRSASPSLPSLQLNAGNRTNPVQLPFKVLVTRAVHNHLLKLTSLKSNSYGADSDDGGIRRLLV